MSVSHVWTFLVSPEYDFFDVASCETFWQVTCTLLLLAKFTERSIGPNFEIGAFRETFWRLLHKKEGLLEKHPVNDFQKKKQIDDPASEAYAHEGMVKVIVLTFLIRLLEGKVDDVWAQ